MKQLFLVFCALYLGGNFIVSAQENSISNKVGEKYIHAHPDLSDSKRKAIEAGQVLKGMCPNEAIAAAGIPYFYDAQSDKKWPSNTDPQFAIENQCEAPDKSKITFYFENKTQFRKESKFKVIFLNGQITDISSL
jgi:hypothetical protein